MRSATVSLDGGQLLSAWVAGDDVISAPNGTAFLLPSHATLHVSIRYRKHWQDEAVDRLDRCKVGLYFANRSIDAKRIEGMPLESASEGHAASPAAEIVLKEPRSDPRGRRLP